MPLVVFGLYGGAIADAVDRRRLYIGPPASSGPPPARLLLQAILHAHSRWLLLGVVAIQTVGFAVSSPVRWRDHAAADPAETWCPPATR